MWSPRSPRPYAVQSKHFLLRYHIRRRLGRRGRFSGCGRSDSFHVAVVHGTGEGGCASRSTRSKGWIGLCLLHIRSLHSLDIVKRLPIPSLSLPLSRVIAMHLYSGPSADTCTHSAHAHTCIRAHSVTQFRLCKGCQGNHAVPDAHSASDLLIVRYMLPCSPGSQARTHAWRGKQRPGRIGENAKP